MSEIFLISKKKIWCLCGGGCSISFHHRCVSTVGQCKSFSLWLNKSSSERLFADLSLINSIDPNCLSSYVHVLKSQVNFNCESSSSFRRPGNKPHIAIPRLRHSINLDIKPNFWIHTCLHILVYETLLSVILVIKIQRFIWEYNRGLWTETEETTILNAHLTIKKRQKTLSYH